MDGPTDGVSTHRLIGMTRLLATCVAALLLLPAATAAAKAPAKAKIVKTTGEGEVIAYGADAPEGTPLSGTTMKRRHVYEFRGLAATIRMGRTTYKAAPGTIVLLTQYAVSKTAPRWGALGMLVGTLDVTTPSRAPGGVTSEEGLFGPIDPYKMRYRVSRELNDDAPVEPNDVGAFFANVYNQRAGKTTVESLDGHTVNITPYVGAKPGTCRHADKATLKTTSTFGKGTASYDLS
jgi:hypothetical protein